MNGLLNTNKNTLINPWINIFFVSNRDSFIYNINSYSQICGDEKIEALLLSNRAMCQILLRNNRSALTDCKLCIRYSPSNVKAHYRYEGAFLC